MKLHSGFTSTILRLVTACVVFVSCHSNSERKEVGQNGVIEVARRSSPYASDYRKAADLVQANEFDEAIAIYTRLCKIEADSLKTNAYLGLGSAYTLARDYQNALNSYAKSIELNSKNADAYMGMGSAYYGQGDYNKAVQYYDYARKLNSDIPENYWGLAIAYHALNMADSAKANARHFLQLEPGSKYRNVAEDILSK